MGVLGKRKFASSFESFSISGPGSADVRAVQRERSLMRRSSRMRSWMGAILLGWLGCEGLWGCQKIDVWRTKLCTYLEKR